VCSRLLLRGAELGIESPVPGQSPEFSGAYRFERPIDACELAPGLENTPQRRVSLESNERNFLSLTEGSPKTTPIDGSNSHLVKRANPVAACPRGRQQFRHTPKRR
jgi:hypothetical protein